MQYSVELFTAWDYLLIDQKVSTYLSRFLTKEMFPVYSEMRLYGEPALELRGAPVLWSDRPLGPPRTISSGLDKSCRLRGMHAHHHNDQPHPLARSQFTSGLIGAI